MKVTELTKESILALDEAKFINGEYVKSGKKVYVKLGEVEEVLTKIFPDEKIEAYVVKMRDVSLDSLITATSAEILKKILVFGKSIDITEIEFDE